ncbi:MAG: site-specific DNA-methyltransferase [Clostridia bacterium]|nr:site-specific DNA-methyltransferase [Clostridia bacterium]
MPSPRNKTVYLTEDQKETLLSRCISAEDYVTNTPDTAVICGDCTEIMPQLQRGCVDLLIADPPYNLRKKYSDSTFQKMREDEYRSFTAAWLDAAIPLLKPDASVYVCCDWESSIIIVEELKKRFRIRNRITWQREKGRGAKDNWKNSMEDVWYATLSKDFYFDLESVKQRRKVIAPYRDESGSPKDWQETEDGRFRDTCPSNFWDDITVPYWSMSENTPHPTQKPEKLLAKLILASSPVGGLVFDPFAGSGTTGVTASKLGRRCLCIEQQPEYCALTQFRLEKAKTNKTIQGYSKGVFWERHTSDICNPSQDKE